MTIDYVKTQGGDKINANELNADIVAFVECVHAGTKQKNAKYYHDAVERIILEGWQRSRIDPEHLYNDVCMSSSIYS